MLRKFIMLCPALAFALPFVAANPTMARPLASPAQPAEWGDRDDGDQVQLTVCTETQIFVGTGDDHRSYSCDYVTGPQCLANCTAAAVAPYCNAQLGLGARAADITSCQEERAAACRSECEGGTAMFCSPDLKARWGGWHDDDDDLFQQIKDDRDDRDDDDDHGNDIEEIVFVSTETCLDLDADNW